MTRATIQEWLNRCPFEPFEIRMENDESFIVSHSESAALGQTKMIVARPNSDSYVELDLIQVASLERINATDGKRIDSWTDLCGLLDKLQGSWLFRGTSKCYGNLRPTLIRELSAETSHFRLSEAEGMAIREFSRAAHLHAPSGSVGRLRTTELNALSFDERLEWSIYLQHYQGASRLLDWTGSLFVAAYFAVVNNWDEDGELWMFDERSLTNAAADAARWPEGITGSDHFETVDEYHQAASESPLGRQLSVLRKQDSVRLPKHLKSDPTFGALCTLDVNQILSIIGQLAQCDVDLMVDSLHKDVIFPFTTPSPTDRMHAQQGWFTVSLNPLIDHRCMTDVGVKLERLVIPRNAKPDILSKLHSANVTAHSLFPGLDGVGRVVREQLRLTNRV